MHVLLCTFRMDLGLRRAISLPHLLELIGVLLQLLLERLKLIGIGHSPSIQSVAVLECAILEGHMARITVILFVGMATAMGVAIGVGKLGAKAPGQTFQNVLEQQIAAKEREGLDDLKKGNVDAFGKLIARDAVFVDDHGPATRAEVLQHLGGFRLTSYTMENLRFVPISGRSGLIVYTTREVGTSHGRRFSSRAYVSSVWEQRGSDWLCVFSQETAAN